MADMVHLLHDFIFNIPRKNENVIRFRLTNPVWGVDWNMRTWEKTTLLMRIAINSVLDQIGSYSAVVQKSIPLAGAPYATTDFSSVFAAARKSRSFRLVLSTWLPNAR